MCHFPVKTFALVQWTHSCIMCGEKVNYNSSNELVEGYLQGAGDDCIEMCHHNIVDD